MTAHPVNRLRPSLSHALRFILLSFLVGCNSAVPPPEEVPPAPVKWEAPRQLFLEEWTELVGTTQQLPDHTARVTAPVEGRVLSVLQGAAGKSIVEGQMVAAGDVLVRLDDTVLRIQRDKAESAKKVLLAEQQVANLAVKLAALDVKRLKELKRQQDQGAGMQLVAPIELEKAELALETAKAHVLADDRKLEAADEEVAALDRQLKLYTLTAPRKGRLGRLQVVVGQTLAIGTVVAEIVDIEDEIDVLCFVPAADIRKLQIGQPVHVGSIEKDLMAETGPDPEGKVEYLADQAEMETGHFAVKVRFPNSDLKLRANSVVRVRVQTKPGKECWCVPEAALMEDQDPPGIVVVEDIVEKKNKEGKEEEIGKARRLQAVVGVRNRVLGQVEILRLDDPEKKWQGNMDKDLQVIVAKAQGIQTGDPVRLEVEEDEETPPAQPEKKKE
jgi:RND family efflux transporter MFP subunit